MSVQLYPGMPFSPQAALTNNIGAADTVIEVSDISAFPQSACFTPLIQREKLLGCPNL